MGVWSGAVWAALRRAQGVRGAGWGVEVWWFMAVCFRVFFHLWGGGGGPHSPSLYMRRQRGSDDGQGGWGGDGCPGWVSMSITLRIGEEGGDEGWKGGRCICTPPLIRTVVRTSVNTGWNGGFNPSGIRKVSVRSRQASVNTRDFECEVVRTSVNTGDFEPLICANLR